MKAKKFLPAVMALLFMFSVVLAGCGNKDEDAKDKGGSSSKDNVTVDIFQFKVEFKDQFEEVAKQYEELNKGVKINITTVGGGEDYGAALRSKFASGNEPTIYNVGGPQDVKDWDGKLANLSDTKAAGLALEGTLEGVSKDGEVLGLPYNQEGYGLIYNTAVFEKAGINPADITTFAALEEAVKTLDSKKKDLGLDAVFALPGKEAWVTGLHLSNTFISPEFEGKVLDTFEAKTVDFKYADAFKKVLDLQNDYSVQPTVSLDYSMQVEELFSTGKVAMIQQGNWVYGSIAGIDEELANNNISILPLPVVGYKEDSIPVGVPMYWAVNKNKDEKEIAEAKKFLDWLYTSDEGKETVLNDFKFIPAYDGFDASKISDPLGKAVYDYASEGKTIPWVFMGYPTSWGEQQLGVNIQKYISDNMSWEDLVKESKAAWEDARK
ncbi:ABC transporter substrate-binding protein [Fredinandcohnia quinoae]|uniref:ABC transporter substrate-binding protein n=1 Tax=Fredinandcohnia quinoae TaxID=2918902 RepID=A0AAW5E0K1_9BACI|nr:ABC transporter substrate-binding protein [Fredinandcohnia sp. SECRCQ15]MCH1626138.1 ABC transporter substrate-binding protein [Fredinandcohnia sp. SECRCQ15]